MGCGQDTATCSSGASARPRGGSASASVGNGACSAGAALAGMRPSGNRAFDEYREEALRRLEEEANEFRSFLERLRMAKDRAEFDDFMRERRSRQAGSAGPGTARARSRRLQG